jgi:hypothetical protein
MLYRVCSNGGVMIRAETYNGITWHKVPVGKHLPYRSIFADGLSDVIDEMTKWCDEQSSQSMYCLELGKCTIDPSTFQPRIHNGSFWFESPEMANWFNLRWSHI